MDWGVKRLELFHLYSTQTLRAAPREEQAAAEVTLARDEETEPDGKIDENLSEDYCKLFYRQVKRD